MKRILVLGAGLVAKPLVDYLATSDGLELTVADIDASKAEALTLNHSNASALQLDVNDQSKADDLVAAHDLSVSLLPTPAHTNIARTCLRHAKHMATASYISPEMKDLDAEAKAAGLTFINECGVDPGLDHMSALRVIHGVKKNGGTVLSFRSYCGGLPAPEANTNPMGYKFSWAPKGVLTAATTPARYRSNGSVVEVAGDELFADPELVELPGIGRFEGYPNRDALPYIEMYGLKDVETMFRGTLRNEGHCAACYHWVKSGMLDGAERTDLDTLTYKDLMRDIAGGAADPKQALVEMWGLTDDHPAIANLEWLGMFDETPVSLKCGSNLDILAKRMAEKCAYAEGERDMLLMRHEFVVRFDDAEKKLYSTLVAYGIPGGDSAMARTVSLPLAVATRMILEGSITARGVVVPMTPEIYDPILDELERMGIVFEEGRG